MIQYPRIIEKGIHNNTGSIEYNRLKVTSVITMECYYIVPSGTTDFTGWCENAATIIGHKLTSATPPEYPIEVAMPLSDLRSMIETGFVNCENRFDFIELSKKCIAYIDGHLAQKQRQLETLLTDTSIVTTEDDLLTLIKEEL